MALSMLWPTMLLMLLPATMLWLIRRLFPMMSTIFAVYGIDSILSTVLSPVLPGGSPILFTVSSSMVYGTAFDVTVIGIAARIASCRAWPGMGAAS